MEDLSKYPGLFSRGGVWYVRKTVPKELHHLRKSNFKTSLSVSDLTTAKKLYHQAMLEIQGKIESLRQDELKSTEKKEEFDALSKEQVIALAYSWYNAYKSKLDKAELRNSTQSYDDEDVAEASMNLEIDLQNYTDSLNKNSYDVLYPKIPVWLESHGYVVNQSSLNYAHFCQNVLQSLIFDIRQRLSTLKTGATSSKVPPMFVSYAHSQQNVAGGKAGKRITLKQLADDFLSQPNKASISEKNKGRYYAIIKLLNSHAGKELYADEVGREFLQEHRNKLMEYPSKASQKFKKMEFDEVLEISKNDKTLDRLSVKTINTHIHTIGSLLEHAELNDYIHRNPAVKLSLIDSEPNSEKKKPWPLECLIQIFNTPLCDLNNASRFSGSKYNEAVYWFQLIALWAGLSSKEIAMLHTSDIKYEEGVHYFDVMNKVDEKGVLVKTKNLFRIRRVPVHEELVRVGFLDFVKQPKKDQWLFPNLYWNESNSRGQKVGEHFSKYCKKHGIVKKKCSFHSFRHNYRDALRNTEMNKEIALALGGWSEGEGKLVADDYGQGYFLKKLNENLQKIKYEGLDLSHLYKNI